MYATGDDPHIVAREGWHTANSDRRGRADPGETRRAGSLGGETKLFGFSWQVMAPPRQADPNAAARLQELPDEPRLGPPTCGPQGSAIAPPPAQTT